MKERKKEAYEYSFRISNKERKKERKIEKGMKEWNKFLEMEKKKQGNLGRWKRKRKKDRMKLWEKT